MEWSLFMPLVIAGIAFAALSAAAGVASARGNDARAERFRDVAFLIALAAAAWVVVLLLISLFQETDELWDLVSIVVVVAVFFVLLLLLFFALSLLFGLVGRALSRRKRVTTQDL
jgi:hypothetical protein